MNAIHACFKLQRGEFSLDIAFAMPITGITAVFGPSGSGKTTLLRCIAGLERAPHGVFEINGERWQDETQKLFLAPHRRALGYVFQDARLFPHLSVQRNLEYGYKRTPAAARKLDFAQAVEWLGLRNLLARMPEHLSGGEKQRVAIARALLAGPQLLIMDEPLASLDSAGKAEILPYLERLHDTLSIPVIYVSHALEEVARLADTMVLLAAGRVLSSGNLADVMTRLDLPIAHLDEAGASIEAVVAGHDDEFHLTYLDFAGGRISTARQAVQPGQQVRVRILARDVSLALTAPQHTSILNIFAANIEAIAEHNPAQLLLKLNLNGVSLLARITRKSAALLDLKIGQSVYAQVKSVALMA